MTPVSTNRTAPLGSVVVLGDATHVVGQCCAHWKCIWCGNRKHMQAIVDDTGLATGVAEACESCDYDEFNHESI